jgi:signal transduction protein with GAF and PtsI domain
VPGHDETAAGTSGVRGRETGHNPAAVELLRSATALAMAMFDAAACSAALLDEDETHLTFVAASGAGADQIVGLRLPVNRGIAGWVVSSGQPIGIEDVQADARFEMDVAMSTGYVPTSILAGPIEGAGDTLGVIQLLDPAPSTDRQDMALLGLLSSHAALCVEVSAGRAVEPSMAARTAPTVRDVDVAVSQLKGLEPDDQRTAIELLSTFVAHTRR